MRKKILGIVMTSLMAMDADAQVYAGDTWMQMPTRDLYDTGMMNMYLHALAETAELRKENYYRYSNMAIEAYNNEQWNYAIYYVNEALSTKYYSGQLYYIRGYAYERNGNIRAAKKDYKTGKKYNCPEAAQALEALKARSKRR